jgi:hypothetical protein
VQDAVEFLMAFVIPIGKTSVAATQKEISNVIQIPNWLEDPINLSYYLHYFRGEISELPQLQQQPAYSKTVTDQIIVLQLDGLPSEYTLDFVK